MKRLALLRRAARVQRMHTQPTLRPQTVGEHTFNAMAILDYVDPEADKVVWRALLHHDAAEAITGDVPATAKWRFEMLSSAISQAECTLETEYDMIVPLTKEQIGILKYCDIMELAMFGIEEAERGDLAMVKVARACIKAIEDKGLQSINVRANELFNHTASYLAREFYSVRGVFLNEF